MKTTKIIVIATAVTLALILACGIATADPDHGEFYPKLAVVTSWETIGEGLTLVTCMDRNGALWGFYADPDSYHVGDLLNLLMWNLGEAEEDDEIVEVYFETHLNIIDTARWMEQ